MLVICTRWHVRFVGRALVFPEAAHSTQWKTEKKPGREMGQYINNASCSAARSDVGFVFVVLLAWLLWSILFRRGEMRGNQMARDVCFWTRAWRHRARMYYAYNDSGLCWLESDAHVSWHYTSAFILLMGVCKVIYTVSVFACFFRT